MNTAPTTYAIRVEGHLDDHWSAWLGGLDMTRDDDGATTVTVQVADQAQLHGVLAGLRDIGAVISELRTTGCTGATRRSVLERPLRTERLTLRPATADDADATWSFRRLESVNEWLTGCPADLDGYRELFSEPARLATTVIVTLGHDAAAPIIGDFMLRRENAGPARCAARPATRRPSSAGSSIPPTPATATPPKPCVSSSATASRTSACAGSARTASSTTTPSWRLMERVGMRRELHAVRESLHRSGRWLDTVGYAILEEEWSRS